jgi:pilus assembly protein CpaE
MDERNEYQVKTSLRRKILSQLDLEKLWRINSETGRDEVRVLIRQTVNSEAVPLSFAERERLAREIFDEIFALRPPEPMPYRAIHGIAVAVLAEDGERLAILQGRVEATHVARIVFSHLGFPVGTTDPVVRQIQDQRAEVVLVDVNPDDPPRAIQAIELIRATTSEISIFAIGEMHDAQHIVTAMRAGAGEFLDRAAGVEAVVEAFNRFSVSRSRTRRSNGKARVFTVINAKGGAGATTLAVNLATALQQKHGQTVLVDFAPIGHAALHLNARPMFSVMDALHNLHRIDETLLAGLVTTTIADLHLLAGPPQPNATTATTAELTGLLRLLVNHYRYVVVDCSGRVDDNTRLLADLSNEVLLVAQTDVVSLWSAARVRTFLEEGTSRNRPRLILNRYKKIPGFAKEDIEAATGCQLFWKLPNNHRLVAPAIDKGVPVATQDNQELSRSFRSLARLLATNNDRDEPGEADSPGVSVPAPKRGGPPRLPPRREAWEF